MYSLRGRGTFCRKSPSLALPPGKNVGWGNAGGGGFSKRSSATSIGAACGRLFRLRKTAMLSRHWRLWLSFPSPGPLPKSGWGSSWFFLHTICPCEVGADSCELVEVTAADRAAATVRGGETPGEAASLREAPPPDPLPKSGWGSSWFFFRAICPCELARIPASWLRSRRLTEPPRPCGVGKRENSDGVGHRSSCDGGIRVGYVLGTLRRGSLLAVSRTKPPLKGEVPALGGRRGLSPTPQRSRRLCQPP